MLSGKQTLYGFFECIESSMTSENGYTIVVTVFCIFQILGLFIMYAVSYFRHHPCYRRLFLSCGVFCMCGMFVSGCLEIIHKDFTVFTDRNTAVATWLFFGGFNLWYIFRCIAICYVDEIYIVYCFSLLSKLLFCVGLSGLCMWIMVSS